MLPKILFVDTTEPKRPSQKLVLANQGYCVETAESGMEALKKISAFHPELIFLDISAPNTDGIECCRRIKSNNHTRDIKVVMVSTTDDYREISKAFAAGCDDFVVKPIDNAELVLTVRDLLKFSHPIHNRSEA